MTNISSNMVITDESLSQISRELIDKRTYDGSKITVIGSPQILNGIASNLSNTDYLRHDGIALSSDYDSTTITFKGNIVETGCAFSFKDLSLCVNYSSVSLNKDDVSLVEINNLNLKENDAITCNINFTNSSCTLQLITDNSVFTSTEELQEPIDFSTYSLLILGTDFVYPWQGSIALADFSIIQDDKIIYSPSSEISFTFTKILVGDGKYPLVNNSGPILNHVYEFPVQEISRTNNNVLLTATISEDAHLMISELALYCEFGDGSTHIFSKMSGLSIAKGKDIEYNLILHVKLDVNVVNTVAFPEIIIKDVNNCSFSDFKTVKEVYAYATENLERMIKINALGIGNYSNGIMKENKPVGVGYNKAQVYCLQQDKMNMWEDNFCAALSYARIKDKFKAHTTVTTKFNKSLLKAYGDSIITDEGEASVLDESSTENVYVNRSEEALVGNSTQFMVDVSNEAFVAPLGDFSVDIVGEVMSTTSKARIEPNLFQPRGFNQWEFMVGFDTNEDNYRSSMAIINFANDSVNPPLSLTLENGKCRLILSQIETLQVHTSGSSNSIFFQKGTGSYLYDGIVYYDWLTQSDPLTNLHFNVVGTPTISNGIVNNFSESNYLTLPSNFDPEDSSWSIESTIILGDTVNGGLFDFSSGSGTDAYGVKSYVDGNKIKVLINVKDGESASISKTLESTTELEPNTTSTFKISYDKDTNTYALSVNDVIEDSFEYNDIIRISSSTSVIGKTSAEGAFSGYLNLNAFKVMEKESTLTGACTSRTILTDVVNPDSSSIYYDEQGYELPNLVFDNFFTGVLIDRNLFDIQAPAHYLVKVRFDGHAYTASYSLDGGSYRSVLNFESNIMINSVKQIVIGAQYNAQSKGYIYQYTGTLRLNEYDIVFYNYNDSGTLSYKARYYFNNETTSLSTTLIDYFHIPEYLYNYFVVNNLGVENDNSVIEVYDGYLKGREDNIDFSSGYDGFTLCVKMLLPDLENRVILAKGDLETENFYFILKMEDKKLTFEYYLGDDIITLFKEIKEDDESKYLINPVSIFVSCSNDASPTFKMYRNNELLATIQAGQQSTLVASDYYLINSLNPESALSDNRIVYDVLGFSGLLSDEQLYFANNLLDTNF